MLQPLDKSALAPVLDAAQPARPHHALRSALGRFATGVTVVAAEGQDGQVHCITVNSFSSLSLDPALVMWALRTGSTRFDTFTRCETFSVNVLADTQVALARRHAKSPPVLVPVHDWMDRVEGCPVIPGAASQFVCRLTTQVPQGDHVLLVGEILHFAQSEAHPLLFMSGGFHSGKGLKKL